MHRIRLRRLVQHSFADFRVRAAMGGVLAGFSGNQSALASVISSWAGLRVRCVRVAVRVEYSYKNRQDWLRIRSELFHREKFRVIKEMAGVISHQTLDDSEEELYFLELDMFDVIL